MFLSIKKLLKIIWAFILRGGSKNIDLNHETLITTFAKILKPKVYVELGIYHCSLFNKMIPLVKQKLIGVDINSISGSYMKKNKKTEFFCGSTDEFIQVLINKKIEIDFLFIDANHNKESVLNDFKNYFPLVKEDGIIFLHDGYPKNEFFIQPGYCSNCYEAIFELSQNAKEYEMVTIPLHPGLTICQKRKKQIPWK